ncbi:MAG: RNA polymerase sigma factor RpoD/SigA [Spirochaetaceae bacterium]|jgi:RNA polymerase primary sigma factor|nr:RNA polymerase sigma factor RpoD/SigA [Spirochaetaceae bacterium]
MMHKKPAPLGNEDILQKYFTEIKAIPLLTFAEELDLSKRIQRGDIAARQRLIEANLRLVVKIARTFLGSNAALMDLIQEGNIGLMHAAEKYDHLKNVRFSTYANWWIRQSISRYLANKRRVIRLPHRKEELLRKIQKAYHTLSQILTRQPNITEISEEIGVPAGDIAYILNITNGLLSLETDAGDIESTSLMDVHEDYTYSPERAFMRKSFKVDTLHSLNRLKDREKRILMYRYQLNGDERHTLKTIGDKMGLSPETVRQIEIRALRKMRDNVDPSWHSGYVEAI